jgi:hypothetical protein
VPDIDSATQAQRLTGLHVGPARLGSIGATLSVHVRPSERDERGRGECRADDLKYFLDTLFGWPIITLLFWRCGMTLERANQWWDEQQALKVRQEAAGQTYTPSALSILTHTVHTANGRVTIRVRLTPDGEFEAMEEGT